MNKDIRASEAQQLLNNPLLKEAFSKLDNLYVALWRQANTKEEREACWMAQQLLAAIKGHLEDCVNSDKIKERKAANSLRRAVRSK